MCVFGSKLLIISLIKSYKRHSIFCIIGSQDFHQHRALSWFPSPSPHKTAVITVTYSKMRRGLEATSKKKLQYKKVFLLLTHSVSLKTGNCTVGSWHKYL